MRRDEAEAEERVQTEGAAVPVSEFAAALAYPGPALIHLELNERDISPFTGQSQSYRV